MKCPSCGSKNTLENLRMWFIGPEYFCPACKSFLFLQYEGRRLSREVVLSTEWNKLETKETIAVDDNRCIFIAASDKDYFQLHLLQHLAQKEEPSIKVGHHDKKAMLLVDQIKKEAIAYILWFPYGVLLNQIYVQTEYRRMGYGSKLLRSWILHCIPKSTTIVNIEAPNDDGIAFIEKNRRHFELVGMQAKYVS